MLTESSIEKNLYVPICHRRWGYVRQVLLEELDRSRNNNELQQVFPKFSFRNLARNQFLVNKFLLTKQVRHILENNVEYSSLLGLICHFNPPLDIVHILIQNDPYSSVKQNSSGELPLHIALKTGADVELIKLLSILTVKYDRNLLHHKNVYNLTTPLHILCQSWMKFNLLWNSETDPTDSMCKMLDFMVDMNSPAPEIQHEDYEGMTPLERAIESECPLEFIKLLQTACEKAAKEYFPVPHSIIIREMGEELIQE